MNAEYQGKDDGGALQWWCSMGAQMNPRVQIRLYPSDTGLCGRVFCSANIRKALPTFVTELSEPFNNQI